MSSRIIVVTGAIGSGKSTLMKALADCNCKCINTDEIAKQLITDNAYVVSKLLHMFGKQIEKIVDGIRYVDVAKLRHLLFSDIAALAEYSEFIHCQIFDILQQQNIYHSDQDIFIEIPYVSYMSLALADFFKLNVDMFVNISCDEHICRERIAKRNPDLPQEDLERILMSQLCPFGGLPYIYPFFNFAEFNTCGAETEVNVFAYGWSDQSLTRRFKKEFFTVINADSSIDFRPLFLFAEFDTTYHDDPAANMQAIANRIVKFLKDTE